MWKRVAPFGVGLVAMAARLALLPARPIPEPAVHDEFAYLLGAETFCLGRVTNPAHRMWVHFETFHEIMRPTYASKYPPAQSLILALGWKVLGRPWYGVWLSCGLMCGALCWMLQGWVPGRYAVLGGLMAAAQWGVAGNWVNSYMGGAVAAAAGAVVVGAVPRLARRMTTSVVLLGAVGVVVLANSRPYEGTLMTVGAAAVWWAWPGRNAARWGAVAAGVAVLACGGLATCYYNYRITGSAAVMPYVLYQAQYGASPVWWWVPRGLSPIYRHEEIRRLWEVWDKSFYDAARANPVHLVGVFVGMLRYFLNPISAMALFAAVFLRWGRKVRMALAMVAFPVVGMLLERYSLPHYFAPATGGVLVLTMLGMQYVRAQFGARGLAVIAALFFGVAGYDAGRLTADEYPHSRFTAQRLAAIRRMEGAGGRHLAVVRYGADHDVLEEWVYNRADVDGSAIVWARDMGEAGNRELLEYYRERKVWLVEADGGAGPVAYGSR